MPDFDSGIHYITMVTLLPAGWFPDRTTTGGSMPPRSLMIGSDHWEALGRPASIEEYDQKVAEFRPVNTFDFRGISTLPELCDAEV